MHAVVVDLLTVYSWFPLSLFQWIQVVLFYSLFYLRTTGYFSLEGPSGGLQSNFLFKAESVLSSDHITQDFIQLLCETSKVRKCTTSLGSLYPCLIALPLGQFLFRPNLHLYSWCPLALSLWLDSAMQSLVLLFKSVLVYLEMQLSSCYHVDICLKSFC